MTARTSDDQPRFFISHSSQDREFALALDQSLSGEAWVDLYEIAVGQIILEEIVKGLEGASDFVLLWSLNAARSKWVRFEFNMAFVRYLEDDAIAIRIVLLDDTPVPLQFRPFLQARDVQSAKQVAKLLAGPPPRPPVLRSFVDRNREVDAVESAFYSGTTGHLWLWGFPGIGKRSVIRESLDRIIADRTRVRTVEVRAGTALVELDLLVTAALGAAPPSDSLSSEEAETRATDAITKFAQAGGVWVFEEAQHWLEDDARPGPVLEAVLRSLERATSSQPTRLALFTSSRRPALEGAAARLGADHRVAGLRTDFGVALLRARAATADETVLRRATEELEGHPLALEIVAKDLSETADDPDWEEYRVHAATGMVGGLDLDDTTEALLERVAAVDGPLAAEDYALHLKLSSDVLQEAIATAVSFSLIEESANGYLRLHPLVRDFYMRSFRRRDDFVTQVSDLANRCKELLETTPVDSAAYVDALVATFKLLAWAERLQEAIEIRRNLYGTLFETALELYHQRRYAVARRYFEVVIDSSDDNRNAKLYLARTLAYLGDASKARTTVDHVLEQDVRDHHAWHVRGRIEYILRDFRSAIGFYERSLEIKRDSPATLRDLGQALIRIEDWHGARAALERALELRTRDPDPYLAFQYSLVLEHFEEYAEAGRLMSQAIRRDPHNPMFHHRLGRIARELGEHEQARREFEHALRLDPTQVESHLSLASMAAEQGEVEIARGHLENARQPHVRRAVLNTVEATIRLAERDIQGAREAIQRALAEEREIVSLNLAARIEFEAVAMGEATTSELSDTVRQYAEEVRVRGAAAEADRILERLAGLSV